LRGSDFAVIERQRGGAAELRQPNLKKIENCIDLANFARV
jgi:hypothetical protein